jgi:hypothetical protein
MADDHIEPLTGTPLRGKGRVRNASRSRDPRAIVTTLNQAYSSPSCQENIYELCCLLLDGGKFQVVLVEGEHGRLAPDYGREWGSTISEWTRNSASISAGVIELLRKRGAGVSVIGVDDPAALKEHHAAQSTCRRWERDWRKLVRKFRVAIDEAKAAVGYTADMLWISARLFPEGRDPLRLADRARGFLHIGATAGIDASQIPDLAHLIDSVNDEQSLDFPDVERERAEYVRLLVDTVGAWWKRADGRVVLDPRALSPVGFWMTRTGRSTADVEREIAAEGSLAVLQACDEWLIDFLIDTSLKYRSGLLSHGRYYGDVLALGLRMGIDVQRFGALRRYFEYVEKAGAIAAASFMDGMDTYAEDVMAKIMRTADQREIHELERTAYTLARAGVTELTPELAERFYEDMSWRHVRERLALRSKTAASIHLDRWVDEVSAAAYRFCQISAARAQGMTEEAIRHVSQQDVSGAILVCGGFHPDGISNLLTARYRDVGWSIIVPHMDAADIPEAA